MLIFGQFSDQTQKVMAIARQEAEKAGQHGIGTEHVLLGILQVSLSLPMCFMGKVTADQVRSMILTREKDDSDETQDGAVRIDLLPRTRVMIERAFRESHTSGSNLVRPGHLLIAMLCDPECTGSVILKKLGIDLDAAKKECRDIEKMMTLSEKKNAQLNQPGMPMSGQRQNPQWPAQP